MRSIAIGLRLLAACSPPGAPGMGPARTGENLDELARVQPAAHQRALLVVYPRSRCSGSARTVLVDTSGHFLGAVAPGEAALLAIPEETAHVLAFSSVEVTAALAASEIQWREPRIEEGQAWLDAHHARVHEVLAAR